MWHCLTVFGLRCEKTCLRGFQQSEIQTSLLSYIDQPEIKISLVASLDTKLSKKRITKALIRLRRLVCVFVVRKPPMTGFLATRPILFSTEIPLYRVNPHQIPHNAAFDLGPHGLPNFSDISFQLLMINIFIYFV